MAVSFYLGGTKINVETGHPVVETQDETLDQATITLAFNNLKHAVLPMTKFQIVDDDTNEKLNFVVVADQVEVVQRKPALYKHTLTLAQNTRELSMHFLRTSDFSQPFRNRIYGHLKTMGGFFIEHNESGTQGIWNNQCNLARVWTTPDEETELNFDNPEFNIPERLKFKDFTLNIKTYLWVYRAEEGVNFRFSNPNQNYDYNSFINITILIKRYDNGTLTRTSSFNATDGEQYVSLRDKLGIVEFNNLFINNRTDTTTYKIELAEHPTFNQPTTPLPNMFIVIDDLEGGFQAMAFFDITLTSDSIYYYSLYDVLSFIQKQSVEYRTNRAIFNMPDRLSDEGQYLDSIIAPNFQFTDCTVYEAINQVLDYIDAIATLDEDKVLGFEFYNNFSRIDKPNFADQSINISGEKYANKILTDYQNGRQKNAIYYPAKNRYANVTAEKYGTLTSTNVIFKVNQPIDYVDKVYLHCEFNHLDNTSFYIHFYFNGLTRRIYYIGTHHPDFVDNKLDITDFVYSSEEYETLKSGFANQKYPLKENAIRYDRNGTALYVGGNVVWQDQTQHYLTTAICLLAGKKAWGNANNDIYGFVVISNSGIETTDAPDYLSIRLCVKYHTINSGRVVVEGYVNKYNGEITSSMSNAGTDLYRMGTNMLGVLTRSSNEVYNCVLELTTFDRRLKKGSLWVDDNNDRYIANSVKTTFTTNPDKVIVEVQFIKDFNLISQFIKTSKEKRFYEIDNNLTLKGYQYIIDYIYISREEIYASGVYNARFNINFMTTFIENNFVSGNNNNYKPDSAAIQSFNYIEDETPIILSDVNGFDDAYTTNYYVYVAIPLHSYGSGNMLCFEMGYESAINAGDRLANYDHGKKIFNTLYVNKNGFADEFRFYITDSSRNTGTYINTRNINDYPLLTTLERQLINIDESNGGSRLRYYKKPNEILHLNYEIALLGYDKNIFVGRKLIEDNALFDLDQAKEDIELLLYVSNEDIYSINDNEPFGDSISYEEMTYEITNASRASITFTIENPLNCVSWCIATKTGEVLIAVNETLDLEHPVEKTTFTIHFYATGNRID